MASTAPSRRSFHRVDAWLLSTLVLAAAAYTAPTRAAEGEPRPAHANRLADSKSPYLLLHADNPVDWYPWGEEAFAKAKAEDKPIFLSVGYSTCYWCHVAERTLYSDPFIAELMNRWFVNVKVDREQHPDVDAIYMIARHLIDGTGGWPNNVFLTPDLEPFFAGSYFPPEDGPLGRPGFPRVLRALHATWTTRRDEVLEVAGIVHARMQAVQDPASAGDVASIDPSAWLAESTETFMKRFDPRHGGQRSGTDPSKFPQTPMLLLMLESHRENDDDAALRALTKTLDAMAYGGIYDHLGGGFHRYSTEPTWSVPHFEKMLYDNAQLLEVYAGAYRKTGTPLYRYVAEDVASYLMTQMMSPEGGFFTAQDSQIDGVEGASYRWREEQIEAILGERAAERFFAVYELVRVPEVAGGTGHGADAGGVLRVRLPVEKTLRRAGFEDPAAMLAALRPLRDRLLAARDARPQPLRDEKMNVDLNALAIGGLVSSSAVLDRSDHLDAARRAAERIWRLAYDPQAGRLMHQIYLGEASIEGYSSDYALLGLAFLELHEITGEGIWRERASTLGDRLLDRFMTPQGGLVMTAEGTNLLVPVHSMGDDVQPSGTSAAIELLLRLGESADGVRYRAAAEGVVAFYGARIAMAPAHWPSAVLALNTVETGAGATAAAGTESGGPPLPQSGDRVKISAQISDGTDEDVVVVTLAVDAGYHINANPASLDYLIPTSVAFEGLTPSRTRYPESVPFRPSFADLTIQVYEGEQQVVSTFPDGTLRRGAPVAATVTVQACNEEVCLPPSTIPVTVRASAVSP